MGHYLREIVSQDEMDQEEQKKQARRQNRAAKIKAAIDAEGIEFVLADIIENPIIARIRYDTH